MTRAHLSPCIAAAILCLTAGVTAAPGPPTSSSMDERFPDLSRLLQANKLTIVDQWGGLGPSYSLLARVARRAGEDAFTGVAVLRTARGTSSRVLAVDAELVKALLSEVLSRGEAPPEPQGLARVTWTDDYPEAEVLIEDLPQGAPLRLFFSDQRRRWRLSRGQRSFELAERPGEAAEGRGEPFPRALGQARIHRAFRKLLERAGVPAWIDAEHQEGPKPPKPAVRR